MKRVAFSLFSCFYFTCLVAQPSVPLIGETINLSTFQLIAANNRTIARDKLIVLDFWATWCAPCIAAFPELETLQKTYDGKLQVIALSDEPIDQVNKFLKKKAYSLAFFIDQDKSVFRLFDVEARPLSALLTPTGKLLWVGQSDRLNEVVALYFKGKSTEITPVLNELNSKYYSKPASKPEPGRSVFTYHIAASEATDRYFAKTQKGPKVDSAINIKYVAVPVGEIIQDLLEVPDMRYKSQREDLDTTVVNLEAKTTSPSITYRKFSKRIISDLEEIFQFNVSTDTRQVETYHLKVINKDKLEAFQETIEGGGMVKTEGTKVLMTRLTLNEAAQYFQKKLELFIDFDGQGNTKYNLSLEKFDSIANLEKQLLETYGLGFEKGFANKQFVEIK